MNFARMTSLKLLFTVFIWPNSVTGERWYSAGIRESDHYGTPKYFTTNYLQDSEHRFTPMNAIKQRNSTTNKFFKKQELANKPFVRDPFQDNWKPKYGPVLTETNDLQKSTRKPPTVLRYNNTIKNINVIKTYPKRKIIRKRCPTVRPKKPRQKKQLYSNKTAEPRFLEVFQVVEFDHVACSSSSGLEGVCLPEYDCQVSGGISMGTCADGYGTCCVSECFCNLSA